MGHPSLVPELMATFVRPPRAKLHRLSMRGSECRYVFHMKRAHRRKDRDFLEIDAADGGGTASEEGTISTFSRLNRIAIRLPLVVVLQYTHEVGHARSIGQVGKVRRRVGLL
jgi:hypothetical protein